MISAEQAYYFTPHPNFMQYPPQVPISDPTGAWSAPGQDPIYLNQYGEIAPIDMYNGYAFQPAYNFGFTGTGDYTNWHAIPPQPALNAKALYDEYYPQMNSTNLQDTHIANEHLSKLESNISNGNQAPQVNDNNNNKESNDTSSSGNETDNSSNDKNNDAEIVTTNNTETATSNNTNIAATTTTKVNNSSNNSNNNKQQSINGQKSKSANSKSYASVLCPQSSTTNKKVYPSQNQNILQNNPTNVVTTYAVSNSAAVLNSNRQNIDPIQFLQNNNKQHHQPSYNNQQYMSTNYNTASSYRPNSYSFYNNQQSNFYPHGGQQYQNFGRNRGQHQNSNYNNTFNKRNNNNSGIYTNSNQNRPQTSNNITNNPSTTVTDNSSNTVVASSLKAAPGTTNDNNNNLESSKNEEQNSKTNSDKNAIIQSPNNSISNNSNTSHQQENSPVKNADSTVINKLKSQNQYNPKEFNLSPKGARFFVIKSYSEDDVHRSIKYNIWCSTEHGNRRLDQAFREREGKGPVFLFFSVNGSGHFCGMAEMISCVDYDSKSDVWSQDKWKGKFEVKWIYIKDVPNSQLRNIRLENNENKPVTNSRDTQEILSPKGVQVLRVFHHFRNLTSIFDDFQHYESRQNEDHRRPNVSDVL
jgi:hypothetical protein